MFPRGRSPQLMGKWPIVIVALGMGLTLIWMAALVWFFVTASGFAMSFSHLIG